MSFKKYRRNRRIRRLKKQLAGYYESRIMFRELKAYVSPEAASHWSVEYENKLNNIIAEVEAALEKIEANEK